MSHFGQDFGGSGTRRLLVASLILLAAIVLAADSPGLAQTPSSPSTPTPSGAQPGESSSGQGSTDGREVEAFLDRAVTRQLEDYKIPGATVSVVKDDKVLLAKGYGEADVRTGRAVDSDETLFKLASISKLFTATAVMQLAEEGTLDLDEDVNAYLGDVEVPDTYPGRPVTLRHLLTHTAGFEERFTGSGVRNAAGLGLEEYLAEQMPARTRPPGEVTAYSNYGAALAGLVVEETSGLPFERYVEANVLDPLGMESTTFAQPPKPELGERLVEGYDIEGGRPVAGEFVGYPSDAPASAAITTATDMAAFMTAHLHDGRYGEARILQESTAIQMHARQFANHPSLDGMAFGFDEQTLNGERVIEHGGGQLQYHALVALLPEHDVGIFVAYNSHGDGGDYAEYELVEEFLGHYYPAPPPSVAANPSVERAGNAERLAGSYRPTRSNHTGFEKFMALLNSASVTVNEDGSITTSGVPTRNDLDGGEQRWVEVEPLVFRADGSDEQLAFREGGDGRVEYLFGEANPPNVAYERLPFYEGSRPHLGLLAGSLAVLLLTALAWPVGALISRWRRKRHGKLGEPRDHDVRAPGGARLLAWAVCALDLLFVFGMVLVISNVKVTAYGASPLLISVLTLPLLSTVLTAGVLVNAVLAWRRHYWGAFARLHYSLVALCALIFVALLSYYNLNVFGL